MELTQNVWLDIVEYAEYCGKSISTVRRYIKANTVEHKFQEGKFFIQVADADFAEEKRKKVDNLEVKMLQVRLENERLKERLGKLEEDKRDLEMLVGLYEGQVKGEKKEESLR